eukprot:127489-Rhodomonas_salina.3
MPGTDIAYGAVCLRARYRCPVLRCYAMRSTELAYGASAVLCGARAASRRVHGHDAGRTLPMLLRVCYAMSGTDIACAAIAVLCDVRY